MKIWKFRFNIQELAEVPMPLGARILSVGSQYGVATIWALVNPQAIMVHRRIRVYGTGEDYDSPQDLPFIGTVQFAGGDLVFHFFDDGEQSIHYRLGGNQ